MIKKLMSYGLVGILTTLINIISFSLIDKICTNYKISTIFAWIVAVIFAYITNKKFVFKSNPVTKVEKIKEFNSFILVRILSLGIDLIAMFVLIDFLLMGNLLAKIISNVLVIIINYFASDLIVFKNKK